MMKKKHESNFAKVIDMVMNSLAFFGSLFLIYTLWFGILGILFKTTITIVLFGMALSFLHVNIFLTVEKK